VLHERLLSWVRGEGSFVRSDLGLNGLDPAGPDIRALHVLGMAKGAGRAVGPVFGLFPHLDRLAHAVVNFLGVPACVAFTVMANQDGLAERDIVGNGVNCSVGPVGVLCADCAARN
jgi:hypothetical protein